jgi:hypothetical protein
MIGTGAFAPSPLAGEGMTVVQRPLIVRGSLREQALSWSRRPHPIFSLKY